MSIFVIAEVGYDDRNYETTTVDIDYGYFDTREEAEAYIEKTFGDARRRHEAAMEKYQAALAEAQEKSRQARELGFEYPRHMWPARPWEPTEYTIVEVEKG